MAGGRPVPAPDGDEDLRARASARCARPAGPTRPPMPSRLAGCGSSPGRSGRYSARSMAVARTTRPSSSTTLMALCGAAPHLHRDGNGPWHLHFHQPDVGFVRGWTAGCAVGLAYALGSGHGDRLGVCAGPGCERVFVDVSRNGSRRFCSTACQNRVKAAQYRARRRQEGSRRAGIQPPRHDGATAWRGARLPAGPPDDDPHRRTGRAVRTARVARGARAAARLGRCRGLQVGVVGSGSNLLVADVGVRGLVLKLDKELSTIELDGTQIRCGGGARLPTVSARAAQAGLTGIEFGVSIPGTVGGAVRMNANAYGGELARVLEWVDVVGPSGTERRTPDQLGFAYRRSSLAPGEVVARASFALAEAVSDEVKATLADMRAPPEGRPAVGDQDVRVDLQEPRGPAGREPHRRAAARRRRLPGAARRGRRVLRQARQLRREPWRRDDRRRRRGHGRGAPAGQGAVRHRARARGPGARTGRVPGRVEPGMTIAKARA